MCVFLPRQNCNFVSRYQFFEPARSKDSKADIELIGWILNPSASIVYPARVFISPPAKNLYDVAKTCRGLHDGCKKG